MYILFFQGISKHGAYKCGIHTKHWIHFENLQLSSTASDQFLEEISIYTTAKFFPNFTQTHQETFGTKNLNRQLPPVLSSFSLHKTQSISYPTNSENKLKSTLNVTHSRPNIFASQALLCGWELHSFLNISYRPSLLIPCCTNMKGDLFSSLVSLYVLEAAEKEKGKG